jgi:hypothetical protein
MQKLAKQANLSLKQSTKSIHQVDMASLSEVIQMTHKKGSALRIQLRKSWTGSNGSFDMITYNLAIEKSI